MPKAAGALRIGDSEEPAVAFPGGTLAAKCPCSWSITFAPHYSLLLGQLVGTHTSPYPTRCSDTLLLRDARGLGLPQLREKTREGSLWVAHSQEQGASPQRSRSGASAALGLALGARPAPASSGFAARLRHPRPESVSSAVTIPRGGLTCCPCGRPSTAGWRPACLRAPQPAPRDSAGVRRAPGASTRMGRCRRLPSCWPHPRPAPALHPARPGPAKKP